MQRNRIEEWKQSFISGQCNLHKNMQKRKKSARDKVRKTGRELRTKAFNTACDLRKYIKPVLDSTNNNNKNNSSQTVCMCAYLFSVPTWIK